MDEYQTAKTESHVWTVVNFNKIYLAMLETYWVHPAQYSPKMLDIVEQSAKRMRNGISILKMFCEKYVQIYEIWHNDKTVVPEHIANFLRKYLITAQVPMSSILDMMNVKPTMDEYGDFHKTRSDQKVEDISSQILSFPET